MEFSLTLERLCYLLSAGVNLSFKNDGATTFTSVVNRGALSEMVTLFKTKTTRVIVKYENKFNVHRDIKELLENHI